MHLSALIDRLCAVELSLEGLELFTLPLKLLVCFLLSSYDLVHLFADNGLLPAALRIQLSHKLLPFALRLRLNLLYRLLAFLHLRLKVPLLIEDISLLSLLLLELLFESVTFSYHRWICNDLHLRRCVGFLLELKVLLFKAG